MHNTLKVHMLESQCNLLNVFPNLLLRERDLVLLSTLHDQLQVALFCPLNGDEELVQFVVDEPAQILDNVDLI